MRAREFLFEGEGGDGELSTEEMIHFVSDWELDNIDDDVCNEHYAEGGQHGEYAHLFVGGYAEDGFSEDYGRNIAKQLDAAVRPRGWFVAKCQFKLYDDHFGESDPEGASSQIMCFIDVFPMHGDRVEVPTECWHVCRPEAVAEIEKNGLQPRNGGSDFIQTLNGRIYVCLNQFELQWVAEDFYKHRGWTDLHVFKVYTDEIENDWYEDVEMGGRAAWTPQAIPPEALHHMGPVKNYITYRTRFG
jgi:hypothetical protein